MNVPLSIVEAGKTDEYVRLQKRLDHFTEKKCSAVEAVMRASQKLFSLYPSERKGFYSGVKIPTGLVVEMQNTDTKIGFSTLIAGVKARSTKNMALLITSSTN